MKAVWYRDGESDVETGHLVVLDGGPVGSVTLCGRELFCQKRVWRGPRCRNCQRVFNARLADEVLGPGR